MPWAALYLAVMSHITARKSGCRRLVMTMSVFRVKFVTMMVDNDGVGGDGVGDDNDSSGDGDGCDNGMRC